MRITIVGAGISGLSLAFFLSEKNPESEIIVFESENRAGGKIWTEKVEGFLCEGGVNGFLDNKPKTLELASKLSLIPLRSNDNARRRYIYSDSRLNLIPESPPAFLKSKLISPLGKLRIIGEIFAPKGKGDDETLETFAVRRLGREVFEKLIDPMASGIYAGNPAELSLKSCFPRIYELEKNYGSLIRAMIKLQKQAKKTGKKITAGPGGILTSFYDGMATIVDSFKIYLGDRLKIGKDVKGIEKKGNTFISYFRDGTSHESDYVFLACPAYAASEILRDINKNLSSIIEDIPYPPLSIVCLGFRSNKLNINLNGFGFLVPGREKRKILGTLYDSSIFPNRAPEGHVLLRTMIGGARAGDIALLDDDKLLNTVLAELSEIMGITADPDFVRIFRHEKAIPQYILGHQEKLIKLDNELSKIKGLYITGNAYRGIGVNDCIENSFKIAEKFADFLKQK